MAGDHLQKCIIIIVDSTNKGGANKYIILNLIL